MKSKKGWHRESHRHRLAAMGIKTSRNKFFLIPVRITNRQWNKGDFDQDGVKNKDDCYPLDSREHSEYNDDEEELNEFEFYGKKFDDLADFQKDKIIKAMREEGIPVNRWTIRELNEEDEDDEDD